MTPAYIEHTLDLLQSSLGTVAKANEEADIEVRVMEARTMVENAQQMAALLTATHIQTEFVEFPDEDHFSVVPAALGRAVPFSLGDELPAR
jgi:predicted alpha/beta superfamily hydrolase